MLKIALQVFYLLMLLIETLFALLFLISAMGASIPVMGEPGNPLVFVVVLCFGVIIVGFPHLAITRPVKRKLALLKEADRRARLLNRVAVYQESARMRFAVSLRV